jgi:hypothetical protein
VRVSAPKPATKRSETGQRRPAPPEFQRPTRRLARDRRGATDPDQVEALECNRHGIIGYLDDPDVAKHVLDVLGA